MSNTTDIAALKTRCAAIEQRLTAIEAKNRTQSASIAALRARCTALESAPPFDPAELIARITDLEVQVAKLVAFLLPTDTTPPVTTDDHLSVSLITPCTVTLTPTDSGSGMVGGLAKTEYKVDGAGSYSTGTSVVMTTGEHTVAYRSTDRLGNMETPDKTFSITVVAEESDTTPPVTTDDHDEVDLTSPCTVTLTPTDSGSGMSGGLAKTEYKIDGAATEKTEGSRAQPTEGVTGFDDQKYLGSITMSETGDASKLTLYCSNNWTGHHSCYVKGVIYANNASEPGALLATGTAVLLADNAALAHVDLPFSSDVTLTAGKYWIGIIGDADADGMRIMVNVSGDSCYNVDTYSNGPADPAGAMSHDNNVIAIYATYTVGMEDYATGTSVVMTTGEHTVVYRSTDAAGNMETPDKTFSITVVDEQPPDPPPPNPPGEGEIALSVDHAAVGASVTITGTGFGASQGSSTVTFGERPNSRGWASCARNATIVSWSNTSIVCTVPSMSPGKLGAPNTYHPVYVTVGSTRSKSANFYITPVTTYTGQNYSNANLSSQHDVLYTGCNFTGSGTGNAAMILSGGGYNIAFHNCTFAAANWNGVSINELNNSNIRDITFADCQWPYSDRMNFECTSRYCTTKQHERIALIGCTFEPSGSECVSFDGYNNIPNYNLVKDCLIKGAGNSPTYTQWPHGFEINGGLYYTVQNLTIGQTRAFCVNVRGAANNHWVFENCVFDRSHRYPGQTRNPDNNAVILAEVLADTYWVNCVFNSGTVSYCMFWLENAVDNTFTNCTWLGETTIVYVGTCSGNVGLPN